MKPLFLTVLGAVILSTSCKTNDSAAHSSFEIVINSETPVSDQPILKNVSFLKLETNDECLIEDVSKVIPCKNKLVVLSSSMNGGMPTRDVLIFDNLGRFQNKISRGQGPGELIYPTDIAVNSNGDSLYVVDRCKQINVYDMEGNYQRALCVDKGFMQMMPVASDFLLFDPNLQKEGNYNLRYLCSSNDSTTLLLKQPYNGVSFSLSNLLFRMEDNDVLFSILLSDTVYQVDSHNKMLSPYFVLNFEGRGINQSVPLEALTGFSEYMEMIKNKNMFSGPSDLSVAKDRAFFTLRAKEFYFVACDLHSKKSVLHTKLIEGLPNIYGSCGSISGQVIYAMDAPRLLKSMEEEENSKTELVKQLKQAAITEEDNPILFFGSY